MFKKTVLASAFLLAGYLPFAQAAWKTNVENDIFTGGKSAELVGDISNKNQSLIFDCAAGQLSVSQVEQNSNTVVKGTHHYQSLIKVADNAPLTFNATLARRNPQSIQLESRENGKIKTLLAQLLAQQSREDFLVGVKDGKGNQLSSGAGSVSFANKSVKKFISACNISL
ncbi:hypothetical protein C7387_1327 [Yokenella regensburgei]|uniref:Uncharacterized protein n=1 Tax=Yokenella regensburgei TaxID=158877 RepID=A0ABX9S2Y5_9ENTR|nr:hypothetical protein [Yokenella regensburgei]RKR64626.1 hypothetical protein C7387_1327 [Yokenella regensburgei]VFS23000.1 Uncharacterised protein [Yokenella regensburgei]